MLFNNIIPLSIYAELENNKEYVVFYKYPNLLESIIVNRLNNIIGNTYNYNEHTFIITDYDINTTDNILTIYFKSIKGTPAYVILLLIAIILGISLTIIAFGKRTTTILTKTSTNLFLVIIIIIALIVLINKISTIFTK